MTELYSVTIHRKKIVTRYLDPKGKKTESFEETITETYHDLPLGTARGYMKLDPKAVIEIQDTVVNRFEKPKQSFHVSGNSTAERYGTPRKAKAGDGRTAVKPVEKVPAQASYADVVNSMMKDGA